MVCFLCSFYQQSQCAAIVCWPNKNEIKAFTEQPSILLPNAESTAQLLQRLALMILDSFCSCHALGHKEERRMGRAEQKKQKAEWDRDEMSALEALWMGIKPVPQRGVTGIIYWLPTTYVL